LESACRARLALGSARSGEWANGRTGDGGWGEAAVDAAKRLIGRSGARLRQAYGAAGRCPTKDSGPRPK